MPDIDVLALKIRLRAQVAPLICLALGSSRAWGPSFQLRGKLRSGEGLRIRLWSMFSGFCPVMSCEESEFLPEILFLEVLRWVLVDWLA